MKIRFEFDFKKIFIVGFLTIIAMAIKVAFVAIMLNFIEQFYYEFISTDSSFTKIFHDPKIVIFYASLVVFVIDAIKYNYNYIDSCDDEKRKKMEDAKESRSHILSLLYEEGYEIKLEKRSPTGGYDAYSDHKAAVNPSCKYSYSSEWTEQEIKYDLVYKLLS